tara:strand:- start:52 stop:420 length:369 start_codon:yes stop_codon:yes gene_type:complete
MGRTDIRRSNTCPFNIIEPDLGKVAENGSNSAVNKETWGVFQEEVSGSYFNSQSPDVFPEPALVLGSSLLAGDAERLAGEAANDPIHFVSKRFAVEGSGISPNRCCIQESRFNVVNHERGCR